MSQLPSDEIASDFEGALEDLRSSEEYAISNLVVIARENIQHAQAIARVVVNHIMKTRPEWKLPGMYVLDAISKRVGSPYTVYFRPHLYKTFMDAYTAMNSADRRAMDALLQTWKQPVPGTRDPTPVYPLEVVREIETPLMRWRTTVLQQSRRPNSPYGTRPPGQTQAPPYRQTPPPGSTFPSQPTQQSSVPPQLYQTSNGQYNSLPTRAAPYTQTPPPSGLQLPPQVTPNLQAAPPTSISTSSGTIQFNQPPSSAQNNMITYPPQLYPSSTVTSSQASLPTPAVSAVAPPMDPEAARVLLAQVLGGLLPQQTIAGSAGSSIAPNNPPPNNLPLINPPLGNLTSALPQANIVQSLPPQQSSASISFPNFKDPSSLRVPHPELISKLSPPDQCRQCGMRFVATPKGKRDKQQHLDWHFHNNTRLAEAAKTWKLTQRSWFIDEKDWISYREDPYGSSSASQGPSGAQGVGVGGSNAGTSASSDGNNKSKEHVVPIPMDAMAANSYRCPICQDPFETKWDRQLDMPVWTDAIEIKGSGVMHWSCWQESYGRSARNTPDPVLGKRKFARVEA